MFRTLVIVAFISGCGSPQPSSLKDGNLRKAGGDKTIVLYSEDARVYYVSCDVSNLKSAGVGRDTCHSGNSSYKVMLQSEFKSAVSTELEYEDHVLLDKKVARMKINLDDRKSKKEAFILKQRMDNPNRDNIVDEKVILEMKKLDAEIDDLSAKYLESEAKSLLMNAKNRLLDEILALPVKNPTLVANVFEPDQKGKVVHSVFKALAWKNKN